ncbi:type II toxin-antitoxin system antitoxin DNA ADP-ribosyl glycohydrolase DarG [Jiella mangrovi]|uniref:Macro domain-containing protein n=1 Tax=Jiella mangrovi TaxID=2821407 RepID=A0ABS4BBF2_9HYPH|nr:macro domain-containing protein [Jiella mangrovi]MBP0614083.1 macro domain-containing protein [Jiella mangrovi]
MITFAQGNLLDSPAEALVNTVNTVGVMGKGIALMFKEAFPANFREYSAACKKGEVEVGKVFVTERSDFVNGPRWVVNFPTKKHWRHPSKMEWIEEGLNDLRRFLVEHKVRSVALPPLGSGNGGLDWSRVRPKIETALGSLPDVEVIVFEPTGTYQNVAKRAGVERLTPARALVAELVRRYWILGIECTLLEIQKLAYLLERQIEISGAANPLNLDFRAHRYGPYALKLGHLLNGLDGSYLHCAKRIADADPFEVIWFEDSKKDKVATYLAIEGKAYRAALEATARMIDGFESPLGMELLGTVDWLLKQGAKPEVSAVREALRSWDGGEQAAQRKLNLFDERLISLALRRLTVHGR